MICTNTISIQRPFTRLALVEQTAADRQPDQIPSRPNLRPSMQVNHIPSSTFPSFPPALPRSSYPAFILPEESAGQEHRWLQAEMTCTTLHHHKTPQEMKLQQQQGLYSRIWPCNGTGAGFDLTSSVRHDRGTRSLLHGGLQYENQTSPIYGARTSEPWRAEKVPDAATAIYVHETRTLDRQRVVGAYLFVAILRNCSH
jgi:hypothetical protein